MRDRLEHWWKTSFAGDVYRHSEQVEFGMRALALTAQQTLSAAPALIAAAAIVHRVRGADLVLLLSELFGLHGASLREIHRLFQVVGRPDPEGQALGLLVAALFAVSAAGTMQRCFEQIWGLRPARLRSTWRQVLWVLAVIPAFTTSIRIADATKGVTIAPGVDEALALFGLAAGTTLFYWWTQRLLLRGRIAWRSLLPGSIFIGVGMVVLALFGQYTASAEISETVQDYGLVAAGFVFIFAFWCISIVVLAGALMGAVRHQRAEAADA